MSNKINNETNEFRPETIIEPFRIKMVEPIKMTTLEERRQYLKEADYNLFKIRAENILIDLLTDSGTGAMSAAQWGKMMEGDESYAGSPSFYQFREVVEDYTGFKYIFPVHQGRAAERIFFTVIGKEGYIIPNNTHFDTTRANIEYNKMEAVDLLPDEAKDPASILPFKGNMDLEKLEDLFKKHRENIPLCMITVTNNSGGGQPVSMENIRAVKEICKKYDTPLFLDACRFAENAYFIKEREKGYENTPIVNIVKEMFSYVDGCTMSAKKDGHVNMGGFLAFNDDQLATHVQNMEILTEGFPTYGGLSGRDLSALAQGLKEVVEEDYLKYRIKSTQYLGDALTNAGIPIVRPTGGHAVYIDAKAMLPDIPPHQFPGHALACELYLVGGIRGCEIGSLMFGEAATMELLRLAIPRRTYTQSHIDYCVETLAEINRNKDRIGGMKVVEEPPFLRHFTGTFAPL